MKTSTIVSVLVAIIVIGAVGYWYSMTQTAQAPTITANNIGAADNTPPSDTQQANSTDGVSADINAGVTTGSIPTSVTIVYTANGFSPKTATIKKGGTVTFVNQGTGQMWIASAPHPAHTGYDGTSRTEHCAAGYAGAKPFDECSAGTTFSFIFGQVGSFNYHNHLGSDNFGTISVVE